MQFWEKVRYLLCGEREYRGFSGEQGKYKVDRLSMEVSWTNYRRFRGVFLPPARYQGLLRVSITFNPGLDEALFDSLRTLGETVFFVSPLSTAEEIADSLSSDHHLHRDCPHELEVLVRGPRDVDEVARYFMKLTDISRKAPHRLNGPLTVKERLAMESWLRTLMYTGHNGNFTSALMPFLMKKGDKRQAVANGA